MDKQLPRAGYQHIGGKFRWRTLSGLNPDAPQTVEDARTAYEAKIGRPFTKQEVREFYEGWRMGAITYAVDTLLSVARYLDKHNIEALGDELIALSNKWEKKLKETQGDS